MVFRPLTIHTLRRDVAALVAEWDAYRAELRQALDALTIAADALSVAPNSDRPMHDRTARNRNPHRGTSRNTDTALPLL